MDSPMQAMACEVPRPPLWGLMQSPEAVDAGQTMANP